MNTHITNKIAEYELLNALENLHCQNYEPELLTAMIFLAYTSLNKPVQQQVRNKFPILFTNYFFWYWNAKNKKNFSTKKALEKIIADKAQ